MEATEIPLCVFTCPDFCPVLTGFTMVQRRISPTTGSKSHKRWRRGQRGQATAAAPTGHDLDARRAGVGRGARPRPPDRRPAPGTDDGEGDVAVEPGGHRVQGAGQPVVRALGQQPARRPWSDGRRSPPPRASCSHPARAAARGTRPTSAGAVEPASTAPSARDHVADRVDHHRARRP